jgi:hypothetical protein
VEESTISPEGQFAVNLHGNRDNGLALAVAAFIFDAASKYKKLSYVHERGRISLQTQMSTHNIVGSCKHNPNRYPGIGITDFVREVQPFRCHRVGDAGSRATTIAGSSRI